MRPDAASATDAASSRVTDVTILLVEDDHGDAVLVQAALADAGVADDAVTWRRTLADAVDTLPTRPDCVLLDLGLPDAEGFGAVRKMVEAAPDVAVIVLTGRQERDGVDALAAGAQDYLGKDELSGTLLGRSIRYAIERKRAQATQQQLREYQLGADEKARLERGLLPTPRLLTATTDCATYYRPGRDDAVLGGDFYDVVEPEPGVLRAVIGDVMGHGADEAALGVHLRVAWRSLLLAGIADLDMLPMLDRLLGTEDGWSPRFATVCDLTISDGVMRMRVAGHPAPLVCSADGAEFVEVQPGVPLGVSAPTPGPGWIETEAELPLGASAMLYTDGLLDAFTGDVRAGSIGVEELADAVRADPGRVHPDADWIASLIRGGPRESIDDTAVVVLTRQA